MLDWLENYEVSFRKQVGLKFYAQHAASLKTAALNFEESHQYW